MATHLPGMFVYGTSSEAENFAERLASSGVKTRRVRLEGATHIYITQKGMDNAYYAALHEASEFVSRGE